MDLMAPIRVVVVDDKPTHLISIANGLTMAGIPCVWHWYNAEINKLIPEPPKGGYPHLRMLFTDLNIREMVGANKEAKTLAGILISDVLQPIVAPDGGPYSVVLWTSVEGLAEDVGPLITQRINADLLDPVDRRPQPLSITTLAKRDFVGGFGNAETEKALSQILDVTEVTATALKKSVQTVVSSDPLLRLVASWESRVGLAAASTMKSIHRITVDEARITGLPPASVLETVLAKIAIEATGEQNAIDDPMTALDSGLLDLVIDELGSNSHATDYSAAVKMALEGSLQANPALAHTTRSKLNTHLHVEMTPATRDIVTRGAVFSVDEATLIELTGQDEDKFLDMEFLPKDRSEDLLNQSCIRLIEIGADCDHAQRKPRTLRLLIAAQLPFDYPSARHKKELSKLKSKHDALEALGPWGINGRECVLLVSVRRFVTIQEWTCPEKLKMLYRLRKPVADLILYRYTTHSNRPGIMTING